MDMQEQLFWKRRDDLLRIMTVLWAMAGLGSRQTIAQSLYLAVTRLLRPAEAATRRLIVVLAQKIVVTLKPSRAAPPVPVPDRAEQPGEPGHKPGWTDFALAEPLPGWPELTGEPRGFPGIVSGPDREIDGTRLVDRFDALCHALDDLQAQARRLARWTALRKRARQRGRFCATHPLRTGPPADLRGAARRRLKSHELFHILEDAHERAWWATQAPHDTS